MISINRPTRAHAHIEVNQNDLHPPAPCTLAEMGHDAAEQEALRLHYEAAPEPSPYLPGDPDPLRDGLHAGALSFLSAWADPSLVPPAGARCCSTCHPPDHLPIAAVREVRT